MGEVAQADFARAARGAPIQGGGAAAIEPIVMGISSVARAAVRKVHKLDATRARSYYAGKVAKHLLSGGTAAATARSYGTSFDQYVQWNGAGAAAEVDQADKIAFAPGDVVRAIAHVVLDDGQGSETYEVRVLLWDELPLTQQAAEMIALPALEAAENIYGAGAISVVNVWHLAQGQRESVSPAAARAQQSAVAALVAQFP